MRPGPWRSALRSSKDLTGVDDFAPQELRANRGR